LPELAAVRLAIALLKEKLSVKREATEIFGQERRDALALAAGKNIRQEL